VLLCVVATPPKLSLHNVAQTFVCFQVALVEAVKKGKRNRVETAIVKRKSKVTSCAMLFSPECLWCKPQRMCVVWQGLDSRTKYKSQEASIADKRRNRGAILFGWGDSLLRDMLSAGVFDCLNGVFDDIKVSVRCYVPSVR